MKSKTFITLGAGLAMALAAVLPAAAATATKAPAKPAMTMHATAPAHHMAKKHTYYYVAHKKGGKGCEVTTHRPSKMVVKYYYKSHADAAHALKHAKACH